MASAKHLHPGTRVRLRSWSHTLDVASGSGTIVRPDDLDYFLVRLDRPARYHHADGTIEALDEIVELAGNMEVLVDTPRAAVPAGDGAVVSDTRVVRKPVSRS